MFPLLSSHAHDARPATAPYSPYLKGLYGAVVSICCRVGAVG